MQAVFCWLVLVSVCDNILIVCMVGKTMATKAQSIKLKGPAPTVDQINADRITQVRECTIIRKFLFVRINNIIISYFPLQLANQYWAPYTIENHLPFDDRVVEDVYMKEIHGTK